MDQNDVLPTQTNIQTGYEYAADATDFNSLATNFEYSGKTVPEFTSNEPIVTTTVNVQSPSMRDVYQYTPDYMTSNNYYNAGTHPYQHVNQDNADPEHVSGYEDLNNSVVNTNRDDAYVVPEQPANSCNPETLESNDIEEPVNFESTSGYSIDANDHENSVGVSEEEVLTLPQDVTPLQQDVHFHGDVHMVQHDVDSVQQDVSSETIDQDENMGNEYSTDSSREMVVDETVDVSENVEEVQTAPSITAKVGISSSVVQDVSSETSTEVEMSRPTTQVTETNSTADQNVSISLKLIVL